MTSGKRLLCASLALLPWATAPAHAAKPELEALVAGLARPGAAAVPFVEIRYSHLVKRPLRAEGTLERRDGTLEKRVVKPRRERVAIDAKQAIIERNDVRRRVSLARAPELAALYAGFEALMAGDAAALETHFEPSIAREGVSFTLTLVPRDAKLRARTTLEVRGAGDTVRCVAVLEPDGDASVMAIGAASVGLDPPPARDALARHCRGGA